MTDMSYGRSYDRRQTKPRSWTGAMLAFVAVVFWVSGYVAGGTKHKGDYDFGLAKGYTQGVQDGIAKVRAGEQTRVVLEKKAGLCVYARLACSGKSAW
jgi:hypothetical protein